MARLPFVEDQLLARALPGADPEDLADAFADAGATPLQDLSEIDTTVL